MLTHRLEPTSAQSMASARVSGWPSNWCRSMMLPFIVLVTPSPSTTAPVNSVKTAMQHAARSVRLPDPTDVANCGPALR